MAEKTPKKHQLVSLVNTSVKDFKVEGKSERLQKFVAAALRENGFDAVEEDEREFLCRAMPVWRSKETGMVEPTPRRRKIDIVVYSDEDPVGLVEIESDLNDLKPAGVVSKRSGHYDVFSISRSGSGSYYNSYKSLERMAAAAYYWALRKQSESVLTLREQTEHLEKLVSDLPEIHNPTGLAIILVSGKCRTQDSAILKPRLASLSADLVCVSG